jgi:hypothetical protein
VSYVTFAFSHASVPAGIIAAAMNLLVALLIVLAAAVVAALALVLVRRVVGESLLADSGRGRPMVQVTGTLFAVVLAFVILAAFQTYNNAKAGAQSEASAVLDMARTAALFPPGQRSELRADLVCYGRAVSEQEWATMESGEQSPLVEHWIDAYRSAYQHLALRSAREQLGLEELLTLAHSRGEGRQQRLSDATSTVPTPLWLALIFTGVIAVALQLSMADPRERLAVQAMLIAGLASVVAAGLLIVYFLDHPYQGFSGGLEPTAMRRTLVTIEAVEPNLRLRCGETGEPL